jgi:hypothetical protein
MYSFDNLSVLFSKYIILTDSLGFRAAHGVEVDIVELVKFIQQLGTAQADGSYTTTFGVLFKSDEVQNTLEVFINIRVCHSICLIITISMLSVAGWHPQSSQEAQAADVRTGAAAAGRLGQGGDHVAEASLI